MATQTMAIDSQVHAYERNGPERPWAGALVRTITAGELEERLSTGAPGRLARDPGGPHQTPGARTGSPGQPKAGPGDGQTLGELVDRCGHGGIPGHGRGPEVPDPLPVYRSDSDVHGLEQVGAMRNWSLTLTVPSSVRSMFWVWTHGVRHRCHGRVVVRVQPEWLSRQPAGMAEAARPGHVCPEHPGRTP